MLENFLADLKASLTASPIVKDIEIVDEFITSVSGFLQISYISLYPDFQYPGAPGAYWRARLLASCLRDPC